MKFNLHEEPGEQPEATYNSLSSWIRHTHVKDAKREGGEKRLTLIGDGEVPVPKIVGLLKK